MSDSHYLIFIKHARPTIDPTKPPELWSLSDEGRAAAGVLAQSLREHRAARLFHSDEVKAIETAQILAEAWNVPAELRPDLHEHDRSNVPHMRSGEFISHIELFFRKPNELVLGEETADDCLARFSRAVEAIESDCPEGNLAIVTHGTVLALYLACHGAGKPFDLWRKMPLPSHVILDRESKRVINPGGS